MNLTLEELRAARERAQNTKRPPSRSGEAALKEQNHRRALAFLEVARQQQNAPLGEGSFASPSVAPQGFAGRQIENAGVAGVSAGLRGLGQVGNTAAALLQRNAPVLSSALAGEAPQQAGFTGAQTNPNQSVNAALFNLGSELTEGNRPTGVIMIGPGTDIKNGILYTYQLVDGNGGPVRGYKVKENIEVVRVEGDPANLELDVTRGFVGTSDQGTYKDTVRLNPSQRIPDGIGIIITAVQTFTVRGPDGVEFDLDTIFTHVITVSDGKVEVKTTVGG